MNRYDLRGRTAIVTGGGRGIGLAIAERLLASEANVMVWDADASVLDQAVGALGGSNRVAALAVDVSDEAAVDRGRDATIARFGKADVLVNNAGISGPNQKTWEYSLADWTRVITTDLTGVFICCKALVPHMLAQDYGRIVNIASIAGKEGNPNAPAYSAAKAGVIGLTKSLGKELAGSGVRVNCVTPAVIKTDIFKQMTQAHIDYMLSKIPMGRFGKVEEVGALVAWLASEDCTFSTGAVFDLSGGRATY
ncbi:MAG: SDR family oxidoreductase [Alphaproteobacteria bacterium]|nr:SDR family oxidoreductase [Alphaproteobacteria bacterium]